MIDASRFDVLIKYANSIITTGDLGEIWIDKYDTDQKIHELRMDFCKIVGFYEIKDELKQQGITMSEQFETLYWLLK